MSNLGETIRSISSQTYEASKPSTRIFGTVISVDPLKVQVNEKLVLENNLLILTQTIKNYIDWGILEVGDSVVMTRQPGGQKYILDDMLACDKDIRTDVFLNHTHKYEDADWPSYPMKTTKTGKWVK